MEPLWTKSKWIKNDLDKKTVEFRFPIKGGGIVHGIGELWVSQNPAGLLFIEIVTDIQGRNWAERIQTRYFPPQAAVDRIARHSDPSVADYILM